MPENDNSEEMSDELTAKLIHFHDVTQIDDLDQCKTILQNHNWNVEQAVQSTFNDINEPVAVSTRSTTVTQTAPMYSSHTANSGLRRRVVSPPHSLLHHHTQRPVQMVYMAGGRPPPSGVFGWFHYLLFLPIQYTFSQAFNIVKFVFRIFFPDPRERVTDPLGDVISFISEFQHKYSNSLQFYRGTYGRAKEEAKREIQFLLIYLHDPDNEDTDAFCQDTLCNPRAVEFINRKVMLWGCSISKPEGYRVAKTIRNPVYPLLALTCLYQNQMHVVGRLQGKVTADELIARLTDLIDMYEPTLVSLRADKQTRNQNQIIRKEQDEAYQKSLQEDKEKADKKIREEQEARLLQEKKEQVQREKELNKQLCFQRRARCKEEILPEPDGPSADVYDLVIKLPNGTRLRRKFLAMNSVKTLHDFIYAQDDAPFSFQVYSNFPKRLIPGCCTNTIVKEGVAHLSLREVGLSRNDTLFVQADHADDDDSDESGEDEDSNR